MLTLQCRDLDFDVERVAGCEPELTADPQNELCADAGVLADRDGARIEDRAECEGA